MAGTKVKAIIGVEAIDELVVYDLARGRQVVEICEACSVDAGSLRWSPSGRQLYFSARYRQGDGFDHRHYIYDAKSGAVVPFPMAGVPFEIEVERARFLQPLLWLADKHLAVPTRNRSEGRRDGNGCVRTLKSRVSAVP